MTEVGSPLTSVAEDLSHAGQTSATPVKGDPREVSHILADAWITYTLFFHIYLLSVHIFLFTRSLVLELMKKYD